MADIGNLISSVGFPIAACVALFFGCKYMMEQQQKNIDKMFEMYDKGNSENRTAIEKLTAAVDKLCDKIDKEDN